MGSNILLMREREKGYGCCTPNKLCFFWWQVQINGVSLATHLGQWYAGELDAAKFMLIDNCAVSYMQNSFTYISTNMYTCTHSFTSNMV